MFSAVQTRVNECRRQHVRVLVALCDCRGKPLFELVNATMMALLGNHAFLTRRADFSPCTNCNIQKCISQLQEQKKILINQKVFKRFFAYLIINPFQKHIFLQKRNFKSHVSYTFSDSFLSSRTRFKQPCMINSPKTSGTRHS